MEALILEPTKTTPKVIIDPANHKFEISGEARPENSAKFFTPIIKWLDQYQAVLYWQRSNYNKNPKVSFEFRLDYFNSTSAKFIMDIFTQLEKMKKEGCDTEVLWYYDKRDSDMKDSGIEFSKLSPELAIKYIEV